MGDKPVALNNSLIFKINSVLDWLTRQDLYAVSTIINKMIQVIFNWFYFIFTIFIGTCNK